MTTQYDLLKRLIQRQKQPAHKKSVTNLPQRCCLCEQRLQYDQKDLCGFCIRILIAIKLPKLRKLKDRAFKGGRKKVGKILLQAINRKKREIANRI